MQGLSRFFSHRWQGRVAWTTLFWRDMLLVGTLLSGAGTVVALVLLSQGFATGQVLAVHLLPLPYGLFVVAALWRTPRSPATARALSLGWLALTVLV